MRACWVTGRVVVVLAFKTAYELEHNRRENDKKVISLFVGMKDMMGVLLLYVSPSISCSYSHLAA